MNSLDIRIAIDRDRCMGSGVCTFHAPNTFGIDDTSKAVVVAVAEPLEVLRDAAESCPQRAVTTTAKDQV